MSIRNLLYALAMIGNVLALTWTAAAQAPAGTATPPPRSPRESAQVDLTGNWVAVITEEWQYRMITPPKGDNASVPLNAEGRKVTEAWDLAKDQAAGEQCRPFGAAGLMRLPLRLRVSWSDDKTLKLETDAGQQIRLFNFDKSLQPPAQRSWQGLSVAEWTRPVAAGARGAAPTTPRGALKVVTTNLRPGYLRKNGVPYSDKTVLTEYYDRFPLFGADYIVVTTVVEDPTYLVSPFVTTSQFKREPDASKWNPTPCRVDPPTVRQGQAIR
jgi:hypothetical protein